MLFRKNKINKNIKEAAQEENSSSEFESISSVNKNRFINKLKSKASKEYHDGVLNVKNKYHATLNFFKLHWFRLYKILLVMLYITTIIFGSVILFKPFFANIPGEITTPINNFYTASGTNGSFSYGLTAMGIGFVILFSLCLSMAIFYFVWAFIKHQIVYKQTKTVLILSIVCYCLLFISLMLVAIPIFIRPTFSTSIMNGQKIGNLISIGLNINLTDPERIEAINQLNSIFGLATNSADPIGQFNDNLLDGKFEVSLSLINYSSFQNANSFLPSTLSTIGIVFVCLISIFSGLGLIIIPIIIWTMIMFEEFKLDHDIVYNWNSFKVFFFKFINGFKNFFKLLFSKPLKLFKRKAKEKQEKQTYRKYKKEVSHSKTHIDSNEQFSSEKTDNAVKNLITKEEIESHAPNKAFLNNQGQWMYHDGEGKYFIVKNDEWVPYDIDSAVHVAHVNVTKATNDTEMSKKVAKESKLFKKNKMFDSLAQKSKKEALIDLPDEELDQIIKDLDI